MKNFEEVMAFFKAAVRTGSLIAKDHGATSVDVLCATRVDELPPSVASGAGQLTEALMFVTRVSFEPKRVPVTRTRRLTPYSDDRSGPDNWPSGSMTIDGNSCFFELHAGNATNRGWGVFASVRNNNLLRLNTQLEHFVAQLSRSDVRPHSVLPVARLDSFSL
jgi:hypothetical protein